jgi:hypothetical protein
MRRLLFLAMVILCATTLAACSGGGQSENDDDPTADLTSEQRRVLVAGPNPHCAESAPASQREAFIKDNPDLSDKQLAWVCPDLYPKDYLSEDDRKKLEALSKPDTSTKKPQTSTTPQTTTTPSRTPSESKR